MRHKKGKPPHGRGGPKWNKPRKQGRFGPGNPGAEGSGDHRKREAADRDAVDKADHGQRESRRLFKLVRPSPLVPEGDPIDVHLDDGDAERRRAHTPAGETPVGYLRLHDDGTLSYEEIRTEDESPDEILEKIHDILGPALHDAPEQEETGPFQVSRRPLKDYAIRRDSIPDVIPKLLNYIHSMSNHLAVLQWRELDAADME